MGVELQCVGEKLLRCSGRRLQAHVRGAAL
jgi:hypothetical protein